MTRGLGEWRFDDGSRFIPATIDTAFSTLRFRRGGTGQMNVSWSVAGARGFALEAYGTNGRLRIEAHSGFPDAGNATLFHAPAAARADLGKSERSVAMPEA